MGMIGSQTRMYVPIRPWKRSEDEEESNNIAWWETYLVFRNKQTEMVLDANKQVSISAVVNNLLSKALKIDEMISRELDSVFVRQN